MWKAFFFFFFFSPSSFSSSSVSCVPALVLMLVLGSLRLLFLIFFLLLLLLPHSVPLVVAFLLFPSFFPVPVCAVNTFFLSLLAARMSLFFFRRDRFFPRPQQGLLRGRAQRGLAWSPSSFLASQVLGRLKDEVVVEVALFFFCAEQAGCDAMRLSDTTVQLLWIC